MGRVTCVVSGSSYGAHWLVPNGTLAAHLKTQDNQRVQDAPMVDVSAAKGTDGKLYLALVNFDPSDAAVVTTNLAGTAKGQVLTGPALDTYNSFDQPARITPVKYQDSSRENGKLVFRLPAVHCCGGRATSSCVR